MSDHRRWVRYTPRDTRNAWFAIEDIREAIDQLVTADEVAAKVSERLKHDRVMVLGLGGKVIGAVVALGTLATALHAWIH